MARQIGGRDTGGVEPQVVRYSERPELWDAIEDLSDEVWPEYNQHGDTLNHYWGQLYDVFPVWQFVLYDPDEKLVLAEGHTIPASSDGRNSRREPRRPRQFMGGRDGTGQSAGWLWTGASAVCGGLGRSGSAARPACTDSRSVGLPGLCGAGASPLLRTTATTLSSAASGETRAMKSEEDRLPSASRDAAKPVISTATATSPHPFRNSRSVNGGGAITSGTAVTALVPRRSVIPSRTRTMIVRLPGRSAIRS